MHKLGKENQLLLGTGKSESVKESSCPMMRATTQPIIKSKNSMIILRLFFLQRSTRFSLMKAVQAFTALRKASAPEELDDYILHYIGF